MTKIEEVEKSIAQIKKEYPNVVFKWIDRHDHDVSDGDTKQILKKCVRESFGVVLISIPNDLNLASTILACVTHIAHYDLDTKLASYKHNLAHPDADVAFKTWHEFQRLSK